MPNNTKSREDDPRVKMARHLIEVIYNSSNVLTEHLNSNSEFFKAEFDIVQDIYDYGKSLASKVREEQQTTPSAATSKAESRSGNL